ncbi:hypothetical protein [Micromonospora tarapacensis]|uniref:hypothetical protein n=1 Tax=Micromonospora tarapacensis TaxID=2835305 RepID=UPI002F3E6C89
MKACTTRSGRRLRAASAAASRTAASAGSEPSTPTTTTAAPLAEFTVASLLWAVIEPGRGQYRGRRWPAGRYRRAAR